MLDNIKQIQGYLIEPLTRREKDILALLGQELSDREIADHLTLAVSSVKWYTRQLYGKLSVENRHQAVSRARELGLLAQVIVPGQVRSLPRQLTGFIGRETEIAKAVAMISEYPLVTLTGSGGVGKTRLALKVAEERMGDFVEGVRLVELGALTDPGLVSHALADALGMRESSDQGLMERLIFFLQDRQELIIFDNCEHMLDACAELVSDLLKSLPRLKVLASSREPLGINGEAILRVPSLTFPHECQACELEEMLQFESMRLFLQRARSIRPEFQLTVQNAAAIAQICRRLDGIPLAIELAAARLDSLDEQQIAARLDHSFRLLSGGSRNALPRQQTLRASIDWSRDLLTQPERLLFMRLGVFSGGWTLESAEMVCGFDGLEESEVVDVLASLVKKSLVLTTHISGRQPRCSLLETIRQYTLEKLVDQSALSELRRRHLAAFLQLAEQAQGNLRGPDQIKWYERLEVELDNLRAALEWALCDLEPGRAEDSLRLTCTLTDFWIKNGLYKEGLAWIDRCLGSFSAQKPLPAALRAWADRCTGELCFSLSRYKEALRAFEASVKTYRILDDAHGLIETLAALAIAYLWDHEQDYTDALAAADEGLALARQMGTQWQVAKLLYCKGYVLQFVDLDASFDCLNGSSAGFESTGDRLAQIGPIQELGENAILKGDYPRARSYLSYALAACRDNNCRSELAIILAKLGDTAYLENQYALMEAYFLECLAISRETGFMFGIVFSLHHIGIAVRRQGHLDRAIPFLRDSLQFALDYDCTNNISEAIASAAGIALDTDRPEDAVRLLGALETIFYPVDDCLKITYAEVKRDLAALRACLGDTRFQAALAEGKSMTLPQVKTIALDVFS